MNINIINKLLDYKEKNELTNEDLAEELTNISTDLFGLIYENYWTSSKIGLILRGQRSISNYNDRVVISKLLPTKEHDYKSLIFEDENDITAYLTTLINSINDDKRIIETINNHIRQGYLGYVKGINLFKKSTIFEYKVAVVLETIRNIHSLNGHTTFNNIDFIIRYLEKLINELKIDPKTIKDFRLALPTEGSSLINLKKVGYKFLLAKLSGFNF